MSQANKSNGGRNRKKMTDRQLETAIAIGGFVILIIIIVFILMFTYWGVFGTLWRLFVLALLAGTAYYVWRERRSIGTYIENRRQLAAERAAKAAAALAAAEARKPKPLNGEFPRGITFLGPGTSLVLDRGKLDNPLIYVVAGEVSGTSEPSCIGSNLIVSPPRSRCSEPLPYWPNYRFITPDQRSVYINWLITGRKQLPPEIGYAFLFFYGLERRVLRDKSDLKVIINEVLRLRKLNTQSKDFNRSFDSYTSSFLWFVTVAFSDKIEEDTIKAMVQSTRTWNEDNLSAALSWYIQKNKEIPVWLAMKIARQLPGTQQSVVVDRVGEEFQSLFAKRYSESFGKGLVVESSKRKRAYQYKTASDTIGTAELSGGPNPLGLRSQFNPLCQLWNSCVEDLRQLSSLVKREGHEKITLASWEALPEEIRCRTEHPLTRDVCSLIQECTDDEGNTLIPVSKLAPLFQFPQKDRYTPTESAKFASVIEDVGYCLEPDTRLIKRSYKGSETITAFLRMTDQQTTTSRYTAAACMLRFGMVVAAADGEVLPDELTILLHDLEHMFDLNDHERRRLSALRTLIAATGPDLASLSQMAKILNPSQREAIGKLLLVLAASDGVVTKEEVQAIRKCYQKLGFAQTEIGHAISSLRAYQNEEEPVTIYQGTSATAGEAIPAEKQRPVLKLDRAAIAQIMDDTREVAQMLADAMSKEDKQVGATAFSTAVAVPDIPLEPTSVSKVAIEDTIIPNPSQYIPSDVTDSQNEVNTPPIPAHYENFYQILLKKEEWDLQEINTLAREQGLMLSGAIDALNEWAAEKYGGQLFIEDGPKLYVESSYLN